MHTIKIKDRELVVVVEIGSEYPIAYCHTLLKQGIRQLVFENNESVIAREVPLTSTIIFRYSTATDSDFDSLLGHTVWGSQTFWHHYIEDHNVVTTARESFATLIQSHNIDPNKDYIILEKL